ncbi:MULTISPECIES: winged helix-turn-helix domain-containing protein [Bacteria]|uniref:winged helix-turn-helix domain-containing protein n=1 Tax=Bacteria TaxID=2 RepID=UPI003C7BFE00
MDEGDDPQAPTTAALKAIAHPLRRRILREFQSRQALRAADLSNTLEEPANKISFHLRVLADAGFLAESPELAHDRRDRVWTIVQDGVNLGGGRHPIADRALGGVVLQGMVDDHTEMVRRLASWASDYLSGDDDNAHGTFSRFGLVLAPDEFVAMLARIGEVVEEAKAAHDPDAPDSRLYEMDIVAVDDRL